MTTVESLNNAVSDALVASIEAMLGDYGLEELAGWATGLLTEGASADRIELELENQPAFQRRFPVISQRREAGLPPVSVAEVLQYERQVAELESFYNLPEGTLDAQGAMADDRSYNELQSVVAAEVAFRQSDPETQAFARQFYGMGATQGEVIGALLNEDVGLPVLQQRIQSAQVAGQASVAGFGDLTREEAEDLVSRGVDENEAREAFSLLARSSQLTRNFSRSQLLSIAAGEAPALEALEDSRDAALSVFRQGGGFAGGIAGIGSATR